MKCYDKKGAYCKYCVGPKDSPRWIHGMPRYKCEHPIEMDDSINPDEENLCPESYIREERVGETDPFYEFLKKLQNEK